MSESDHKRIDAAIATVEDQFGVLANRVRENLQNQATKVHPELQAGSYKLLMTIARGGRTSAGSLAETLHSDKSVISRQAKVLEELGLISRHADPRDGRSTLFEATPQAVERITQIQATRRAELYERLRTWTTDEVETLAELLKRLV
ncbi:MarR family winged helix-turn-helix transcriptional regulator [Compostimonas suwonensis]|nr:MarR family transcriptional regulator [Compostimonas suwonensis]